MRQIYSLSVISLDFMYQRKRDDTGTIWVPNNVLKRARQKSEKRFQRSSRENTKGGYYALAKYREHIQCWTGPKPRLQ